jgi:phosphotransferase system HPr (HPr) family protein
MTPTPTHEAILHEDEFAALLRDVSKEFSECLSSIVAHESGFDEIGSMARLVASAHGFETFLDDHGARQNRTFVSLGEIVASVRGIARVRVDNLHLVSRLHRYELLQGCSGLELALEEAEVVLRRSLLGLVGALREELSRLGVPWPIPLPTTQEPVSRQRQLPRNLDAGLAVDEREHIAAIGSRFLSVVAASRNLGLDKHRRGDDLPTFVSHHATEERCRWYQSAVHNIQSMYDTYVLGTSIEEEHPWLHYLRGHATVSFHLLEMATDLVHFYERHENDIRHEAARDVIATVVPKGEILDIAINTYLHHAYVFVEECAEVASRVLTTFVSQQAVDLELPEGVVLHARPLALIVQIARHHGSPIEISIEGDSCSANSLMSLIMLAGQYPECRRLHAKGDSAALEDLKRLFESGLGENGQLPGELSYLSPGN